MTEENPSLADRWKAFVASCDESPEYLHTELVDCWHCLREILQPGDLQDLESLVASWSPILRETRSKHVVVSILRLWQLPFLPIPKWIREKIPFDNQQIGRLASWIDKDPQGIQFLTEFLNYLVAPEDKVPRDFLPSFGTFTRVIRGQYPDST